MANHKEYYCDNCDKTFDEPNRVDHYPMCPDCGEMTYIFMD